MVVLLLLLALRVPSTIFKSFGGSRAQPEFLPPDQAFRVEAERRDATLGDRALCSGARLLSLSRQARVSVEDAGGQPARATLPPAEPGHDPTFG
ncbi:MAG: hypothetical protein U1E63_01900 [Burkholderiales bacterium]